MNDADIGTRGVTQVWHVDHLGRAEALDRAMRALGAARVARRGTYPRWRLISAVQLRESAVIRLMLAARTRAVGPWSRGVAGMGETCTVCLKAIPAGRPLWYRVNAPEDTAHPNCKP